MADILGESQADAMTRVFTKIKKDREIMDANRSPEQKSADDLAKQESYDKAKKKLGYGESES